MEINILEKKDTEMKFSVKGIKNSFASALRRTIISEVPTMSVETVDFKKNDSALNDEIVANRLGLIPLTFDKDAYNIRAECKCEGKGCSNCQVKLVLKKIGPGVVYSGDLKSTAKDVKPVYDKIPITELFEDQDIQLEATAELGVGRTHVKWQGGVVGYKQENESFIFNVESVSGRPVDELVLESAKIVEKKFDEFSKAVKRLK